MTSDPLHCIALSRLVPIVIQTPYDRSFGFFPFFLLVVIVLQSHYHSMASLSVSVVLGLLAGSALGVNNGLARTPQMGWVSSNKPKHTLTCSDPSHSCAYTSKNNWNSLGCDVSDSLLLGTTAKLISSGLRDVGYTYVVLDDCWSAGRRDSDQWLLADQKKFPRGMKAVADDIHALGLLFGMYSSAGEMTCARFGR